MNKRQKKKLNKRFGNQETRNESKTQRGRLNTMVIKDKKKQVNKKKCRGKTNYDNS